MIYVKKSAERKMQFERFCADGTAAEITMVPLASGAEILVATFRPPTDKKLPPIMFVPGMAGVPETFPGVISALTCDFIVHYAETREKSSSKLTPGSGFTVKEIAQDLAELIEKLEMENGRYILISYSLGAVASAEMFASDLKIRPGLMVLIEPSARFRIPAFGLFLAKYLNWTYPLILPLLKLYLRTFMVDTKKDHEMYAILVRALDSADARKLSACLIAISKYSIDYALTGIDVPTIVIGASNDTFHNLGDAREISSNIRNAVYIDLVTNDISHGRQVSDIVRSYLNDHPQKS